MHKRSAAHFNYDEPLASSDEDAAVQPRVRLRHTVIDLGLDESSRLRRTQHIDGPASPRKQIVSSRAQPTWISEGPRPDINIENYPFLDPKYVHFLNVNEPGPPKRHRTASVSSSYLYLHLLSSTLCQDYPLAMWLEDRDIYLGELLRCDGRGDYSSDIGCNFCNIGVPSYRCQDCFGEALFCHTCTVGLHACKPLHRIEVSSLRNHLYRQFSE